MDHQQKSLRFGASVILCALLLRLTASGFLRPLGEFLAKPNIAAFLVYLETGRNVRFSPSSEVLELFAYESAVPDFALEPISESRPLPAFSGQDGESVAFKNSAGKKFDAAQLISRPLQWDLTAAEPTVLILHTHTTESYTPSPGEDYQESSAFRTLDEAYNMISVGDHLARLLQEGGITAVHDRQLHDYPSYSGSYNHARKAMEQYLEEYPTIRLVLDLHRDASGDLNNQMRTEATVNGKPAAQLMLVVGTNGTGLKHPNWEENLALALKLQVQLQRLVPGICRKINLRSQRFNQDESPGALLVEVGAAGNTHPEALRAVEVLAGAILELARGTAEP